MKKNLFEIKTEEVQRILSLHEERSKTQYLNIISEQDNKNSSSYILNQDQSFMQTNQRIFGDYIAPKGTKFEPTSNPSVVMAKGVKVNKWDGSWKAAGAHDISYYCRQGKFYVSGDNEKFTNQVVSNYLKPLCGNVNYQSEKAKSGQTFKQGYSQPFYKPNGDGFAFNLVKGSVWTWDGKNATTKNIFTAGVATSGLDIPPNKINNFGVPTFSCTPTKSVFITIKGGYTDSESPTSLGKLTQDLRKQFCFSKKQDSLKTDVSTQQKTQEKTQQKNNFTALYTIQNNHDLGPVKVNTQDIIIKSFKYPDYAAIMRGNTPIAYYNCKSNTWGNIEISDTEGKLTGTIKEKVCPQVLTPSPVVDPNNPNAQQVVGTNAQQVVGTNAQQAVTPNTQQVNRQQQFAQRTVTAINNVQKTLGVPQTGQLKNSDIDTLLAKLK